MKKTANATRPTVEITTTDGEKTSAATTISFEETTIAAEITNGEMTIITVTMTTIGRRIFGETTIGTANNQGTPKGTTGHKISARSDGALCTTIDEDLDLQGPNHRDHRNSKNDN